MAVAPGGKPKAETPEPGPVTAMEPRDLKKLLVRAKREPVSCALASGEGAGPYLILLDRAKDPRAVLGLLKKQFPTARTPAFGTASVDADANPKQVCFTVNKKAPGVARKLVKALKGTGFTKVLVTGSSPGGSGGG